MNLLLAGFNGLIEAVIVGHEETDEHEAGVKEILEKNPWLKPCGVKPAIPTNHT